MICYVISRDITDTTTPNSWTHANNPQQAQEVSPQALTEPNGVAAVIGRGTGMPRGMADGRKLSGTDQRGRRDPMSAQPKGYGSREDGNGINLLLTATNEATHRSPIQTTASAMRAEIPISSSEGVK